MSAIFGIYYTDGRHVNPSDLQKMATSLKHRGPDARRFLLMNDLGLGHCMLCTTPESINEILPFLDPESGIVITADARIDNRNDLLTKLDAEHLKDASDSRLLLESYKKWDINCFNHLIGDFSTVFVDTSHKKLICGRDYIGVKPLYYYHHDGLFAFSSEIRQLVELQCHHPAANEAVVGEYLSCSFCSRTETLYKQINRLAAGHYLILEAGKISIKSYWNLEPKAYIYYKKTHQYTEHFLELFQKAISDRLRSNGPISAELSGGLDSSTVIGIASDLLKKANKQLDVYSLIFPGKPFDEKYYIDIVGDYNNLPIHYIDGIDWIDTKYDSFVEQNQTIPDVPNLSITTPLIRSISKNGSRIALSGIGGDDCFNGSGFPYLDFLSTGKYSDFINEFHFQAQNSLSKTLKKTTLNLCWPMIPFIIRRGLLNRFTRKNLPNWLTENFISRNNLTERITTSDPRLLLANLGHVSRLIGFGPSKQYALEAIDRHRASWHVEGRHPFLDQRIVEFSLSIPDYECQRLDWIKVLLRNYHNEYLPQAIRERKDKAEFSFLLNQIFQKTLFLTNWQQSEICNNQWVDEKRFTEAITRKIQLVSKNKYASGQKTWELWFAYAINLWYKMSCK